MTVTESFSGLPAEKQNAVIDAALSAFGQNGYKKASVGDIASAAGISKALVFYYFGSKRALYLYLVDLCAHIIVSEVDKNLDRGLTDYFDRIKRTSEIKLAAVKQYPAILSFLKSVYYETAHEVKDIIARMKSLSGQYADSFVFAGTDASKFKDGVDPKLVFKFLIWASEGFASELPADRYADEIDAFTEDFYRCLALLKTHLYKEEYLGNR